MNQTPASVEAPDDEGPSFTGLLVAIVAAAAMALFWGLGKGGSNTLISIGFLLSEAVLISIVIWQTCDPFADAAQWIGDTLRIPGSVRGATLDAIASSMPELFSGIFFVVLAITATDGSQLAVTAAGAEGFGSTIATCAGSAVYNMILIPAFCAIFISIYRPNRPTIDIEGEVIRRDGLWFVCCQILLIAFLFNETMDWWMGLVLIGLYCLYVVKLALDAKKYRRQLHKIKQHLEVVGVEVEATEVVSVMSQNGVKVSQALVLKATEEHISETNTEEIDDEPPGSAGILFGYFDIPLSHATAWLVILVSTLIAAGACYFLVEATRETATLLNIPTFFVAVILAAAVSSVPDTFLSIGSAMRGDDSGAVSNAFGSNIFDLCICLSIPLLVNSYLTGWEPISLLQGGKPIAGLAGLRILLVVLTLITLAIIANKLQITKTKAYILCGLYLVFIMYAVLGSLGILF